MTIFFKSESRFFKRGACCDVKIFRYRPRALKRSGPFGPFASANGIPPFICLQSSPVNLPVKTLVLALGFGAMVASSPLVLAASAQSGTPAKAVSAQKQAKKTAAKKQPAKKASAKQAALKKNPKKKPVRYAKVRRAPS